MAGNRDVSREYYVKEMLRAIDYEDTDYYDEILVQTAEFACEYGCQTSRLSVNTLACVHINDELLLESYPATLMTFGVCNSMYLSDEDKKHQGIAYVSSKNSYDNIEETITGALCRMQLSNKWGNVDESIQVFDHKTNKYCNILTMSSYLTCYRGQGCIFPIHSGQRITAASQTVKVVNNWLRLYSSPTVTPMGDPVAKHANAANYDWGMPEELKDTDIAEKKLPTNSRDDIEITNKGKTQVNFESNNTYVDDEGRYWVGIGPNFLNPSRDNVDPKAPEMKYGTKIDIHVVGQYDNLDYYIPAVIGDCKAHSYNPNDPKACGYYQTGQFYPDAKNRGVGKPDRSTVEFLGYDISTFVDTDGETKSTVNQTNDYILIELIIYKGVYNYK